MNPLSTWFDEHPTFASLEQSYRFIISQPKINWVKEMHILEVRRVIATSFPGSLCRNDNGDPGADEVGVIVPRSDPRTGQFKELPLYIHLKTSGDFNGNGTHNLCGADAMFLQLSYEAIQPGAGQLLGLMCSRERTQWMKEMHIFEEILALNYKLSTFRL